MPKEPIVGLGDAIQALREQLAKARSEGWYQDLGFSIDPVELTVQAVVEVGADGKIGWSVIGVGGEYKAVSTQTLKLTLTPVQRKQDGSVTRDFTIASQESQEPRIGK